MLPTPDISIRLCHSFDDFEACVALQREVWDFSDYEICPSSLFVVAEDIGGQVIGAFERDKLVGFTLSFPGMRLGKPYLHSHMLAVRRECRNAGIGRMLKLFQRSDALARGFERIEWTFDPLEIKNAYINIEKLGAIARRYSPDHYGSLSSPLQGGLPTDRLVAEWWLRSARVEQLLQSGKLTYPTPEMTISVPAEIYSWKATAPGRQKAKHLQARNRELFRDAFARGLCVMGYDKDAVGNGRFLLAKCEGAQKQ
jgi:predicted GNAT superfamily acetyltransferase